MTRALRRAEPGRVLEVGPGGGRLTPILTERFPVYVGVDVTIEFLHRLSRLADFADGFVAADVHHLPFIDSAFSAAVVIRVYNFLVDPSRALSELWRVLAPGGYLFLSYHPLRSLATLQDLFRHALEKPNLAGPTPSVEGRTPPELPSRRSFAATLATSGFERVEEFVTGVEDYRFTRWIPIGSYLGLSELMVEVPLFPQRFVLARKSPAT
ncbi:MAG: class I SAM-dependent methyltransferase [Thermoplasmata archaeon]|nr:class I SAM-dependent methyltransferase [Thermoplasmata archaeon]